MDSYCVEGAQGAVQELMGGRGGGQGEAECGIAFSNSWNYFCW